MLRATTLTLVLISVLGAGCAGSSPQPAQPDTPSPAAWSKDLTMDQKKSFMKANVVPAMHGVFQSVDAKRYASFGCVTCHGPSHQDPHAFLPKLKVKDGAPTAFAEKPEIAKFMAGEVVPKMAATLGVEPYDPKTQQGFGCAGCHTMIME